MKGRSKDPQRPRDQDDDDDDDDGGAGGQGSFQYWLDVAVKLTVPLGAFAAAMLATHFEARASSRELINQREQSETSLRATMFGQLIGTIVGPAKDTQQAPNPIHYALLVKLLALNFHEHFEFGPLMQDAEDRVSANPEGLSAATISTARQDLRSVAHRIIDRQIGSLGPAPAPRCNGGGAAETAIWVFSDSYPPAEITALKQQFSGALDFQLTGPAHLMGTAIPIVNAPNCKDRLSISFSKPDWSVDSIAVEILVQPLGGGGESTNYQFRVTPFSFPFSDNTLLPDGNRFAVFLADKVTASGADGKQLALMVKLRWFPQGFYPPTERPAKLASGSL